MRKCQMVGCHLHSPEYFVFLFFLFFLNGFAWSSDGTFALFAFFAFLVVLHYSHYALDTRISLVYPMYYILYFELLK